MNRASFLGLCYSDIFDYPLTKEELEKWQISLSVIARSEATKSPQTRDPAEVGQSRKIATSRSRGTRNDKLWNFKKGHYCLLGREKIILLRQKRTKISEKKLFVAEKTAQLLSKIPFVKMIAITGALAMKNSDEKDDIDLLIITQKNRVWITRFLVTVILELLGQRRRPKESSYGNKICLNMYLDETQLKVPKREQNLYSAHEVCQIKPIYNKDKIYEKFLISNSWVKRYLPKVLSLSLRGVPPQAERRGNLNKEDFLGLILYPLELLVFKLQYFYMKSKITRETVEKHRILFHPRDTAKMVLVGFEKRVGNN